MKIIQLPEKSQEIVSQLSGEWRNVDIEHFGREINEWKTENFFLFVLRLKWKFVISRKLL